MLLINKAKRLPEKPGVYFFQRGRKILYIGKATSLRQRVRSYFREDLATTRGPKLVGMMAVATGLKHLVTDSALEALILEATLIRRHRPDYNTRDKDDKSFWYIVITKEDWPRVLLRRGRDLIDGRLFGPFPRGSELALAMKIIRRIFPFRDSCVPGAGRPCFNHQIGLCPGMCAGAITSTDYQHTLAEMTLFLSGRKKVLIRQLTREMKAAARLTNFERAVKLRNRLFALNHIQDVALVKKDIAAESLAGDRHLRLEAYDIAHLAGGATVGAMTVMVDGELDRAAYRRFRLRRQSNLEINDPAHLEQIISRRLNHPEWPWPNVIIVDGGAPQRQAALRALAAANRHIPVLAVVKDDHHRAAKVLGPANLVERYREWAIKLNYESHRFALAYHRRLRRAALNRL